MPFLWLTVATVLAHALVPVGSPLARAAGSAFSASTTDVAVKPGKKRGPPEATCHSRSDDDEGCASEGRDAPVLARSETVLATAPRGTPTFAIAPAAPAVSRNAFAFRARAPPLA